MGTNQKSKLHLYQTTVIFSVLFALLGFSYNVWRMEISEENSNIRTASFEMLLELSALEQLIYTAHYDQNIKEGSPRKGWVKVGLISDLSALTNHSVVKQATQLNETWSVHWESMPKDRKSVEIIVTAIDSVRAEIKQVLRELE